MSSKMIDRTEFKSDAIFVEESLCETLYRLGEARHGLREYTDQQIREALDWVASTEKTRDSGRLVFERTSYDRQLTGGYRSETGEYIRKKYLKLPTGEPKWNLPVEYVYTVLVWEKRSAAIVRRARHSFLNVYPGPGTRYAGTKLGYFCCGSCNALCQKTLRLADPELYAESEEAFVDNLRSNRTARGRWRKYPFFYTVLALDEINSEATQEELFNVSEHIDPALLKRYQGNDRASRFRRLAIQAVLRYK